MFTGIIEATGKVESFEQRGGDWRLRVRSAGLDLGDVRTGDSIAVSGACLTAVELGADWFAADVSNETVARTVFAGLARGDQVNLEKAMRATDRLGGHIVSGHVDGIAELLWRRADGRSERLGFRVPEALAHYIAAKGSVCLDGVSLTVNEVSGCEFSVNIIPHTAQETTIGLYRPGRRVNLEVDIISRYLERLLSGAAGGEGSKCLTMEFLAKNGFAGK